MAIHSSILAWRIPWTEEPGGQQSLGRKDPLEEGMPTHSSVLAWRIPWTEEPGGQQPIELQRVRHDWSDLGCRFGKVRLNPLSCPHGPSPVAQTVKNLPAMQKTPVRSLGWEDPLEKGMAIHSRILAWRIPWTVKPGGLQPMGSQRAGHD